MPYPEWQVPPSGEYPMITADTPAFMGQPYITDAKKLKGADAVIIGSTYMASLADMYYGIPTEDWRAAAKRVRQQSLRYSSGYVQEFDLEIFEHLKLVDFGDAELPAELRHERTPEGILKAQHAVETKVNQVLDAGAIPIVLGNNSPCSSYAIAKPIAERTKGNVGVVSIDTHWDIGKIDRLTGDPRIAGASNWKAKMYESHRNMQQKNLVEIGERGMLEDKDRVREFLKQGTHWYPMWKLREIGIEGVCRDLHYAHDGAEAVYVHYDMDVMGSESLGVLADPIGMTDYEILKLSFEVGRSGFNGLSFICIPPNSIATYRFIVYIIMYMLAGKVVARK
ncbi:MAG: arginase family protein [Chloroflexi bacterium]|nr:arginase family protein [Chloroflexota bacterium]